MKKQSYLFQKFQKKYNFFQKSFFDFFSWRSQNVFQKTKSLNLGILPRDFSARGSRRVGSDLPGTSNDFAEKFYPFEQEKMSFLKYGQTFEKRREQKTFENFQRFRPIFKKKKSFSNLMNHSKKISPDSTKKIHLQFLKHKKKRKSSKLFFQNSLLMPKSSSFEIFRNISFFFPQKIGNFFPKQKNFQQYWVFPFLGILFFFSQNSSIGFSKNALCGKKNRGVYSFVPFSTEETNSRMPRSLPSLRDTNEARGSWDGFSHRSAGKKLEENIQHEKFQKSNLEVSFSFSAKDSRKLSEFFQTYEENEMEEFLKFSTKIFQNSILLSPFEQNKNFPFFPSKPQILLQNLLLQKDFLQRIQNKRNSFAWTFYSFDSKGSSFLFENKTFPKKVEFFFPRSDTAFPSLLPARSERSSPFGRSVGLLRSLRWLRHGRSEQSRLNYGFAPNSFVFSNPFKKGDFIFSESMQNSSTPIFEFLKNLSLLDEYRRESTLFPHIFFQNEDFLFFNSFFQNFERKEQAKPISFQKNLGFFNKNSSYSTPLENSKFFHEKTFFFLKNWGKTQKFWNLQTFSPQSHSLSLNDEKKNSASPTARKPVEQEKQKFSPSFRFLPRFQAKQEKEIPFFKNSFNLDEIFLKKFFEKLQENQFQKSIENLSNNFSFAPLQSKGFTEFSGHSGSGAREVVPRTAPFAEQGLRAEQSLPAKRAMGEAISSCGAVPRFSRKDCSEPILSGAKPSHASPFAEQSLREKRGTAPLASRWEKRGMREASATNDDGGARENFSLKESKQTKTEKMFFQFKKQTLDFFLFEHYSSKHKNFVHENFGKNILTPFFFSFDKIGKSQRNKQMSKMFLNNENNQNESLKNSSNGIPSLFRLFSRLALASPSEHHDGENFSAKQFFSGEVAFQKKQEKRPFLFLQPILLDSSSLNFEKSFSLSHQIGFSDRFQENHPVFPKNFSPSTKKSFLFSLSNIFDPFWRNQLSESNNKYVFQLPFENWQKEQIREKNKLPFSVSSSNGTFFERFSENVSNKFFKNFFLNLHSFSNFQKSFLVEASEKAQFVKPLLFTKNESHRFSRSKFVFSLKYKKDLNVSLSGFEKKIQKKNLKKEFFSNFYESPRKFEKVFQTFFSPLNNKNKNFSLRFTASVQKEKKPQKDPIFFKSFSNLLKEYKQRPRFSLFLFKKENNLKTMVSFDEQSPYGSGDERKTLLSRLLRPYSTLFPKGPLRTRREGCEAVPSGRAVPRFAMGKAWEARGAVPAGGAIPRPAPIPRFAGFATGAEQAVEEARRPQNRISPELILKREGFVFLSSKKVYLPSSEHKQKKTFLRLEKEKLLQKKRRLKKEKLETRRRKKRKRFFPRPAWLRMNLYKKFLKTRYSQKFISSSKPFYISPIPSFTGSSHREAWDRFAPVAKRAERGMGAEQSHASPEGTAPLASLAPQREKREIAPLALQSEKRSLHTRFAHFAQQAVQEKLEGKTKSFFFLFPDEKNKKTTYFSFWLKKEFEEKKLRNYLEQTPSLVQLFSRIPSFHENLPICRDDFPRGGESTRSSHREASGAVPSGEAWDCSAKGTNGWNASKKAFEKSSDFQKVNVGAFFLKNHTKTFVKKTFRKNVQKWGFYWKKGFYEKMHSKKSFQNSEFFGFAAAGLTKNVFSSSMNGIEQTKRFNFFETKKQTIVSKNIEHYRISGDVFRDFLRFSWKSSWFQANFQPYTKKIQESFQKIQSFEAEKNISFSLFFPFSSLKQFIFFVQTFPERGLFFFREGFFQSFWTKGEKFENSFFLDKSIAHKFSWYSNIRNSMTSNPIEKRETDFVQKGKNTMNIPEYNRILYLRISEMLRNFKFSENASNDFFFQQLQVQRRKNEKIFSGTNNSFFTKSALFFEKFQVPSQPTLPAFSVFSSLFHDSSIKPTGDLPTLRALWAFQKTNFFHFQETNSLRNVWTFKKRNDMFKSLKGTKHLNTFFRKYNGFETFDMNWRNKLRMVSPAIRIETSKTSSTKKIEEENSFSDLFSPHIQKSSFLFEKKGEFFDHLDRFDTRTLKKFQNAEKKTSLFGIQSFEQNSKISFRYFKYHLSTLSQKNSQKIMFEKSKYLKNKNKQNSAKSSLNFWWAQKPQQEFDFFGTSFRQYHGKIQKNFSFLFVGALFFQFAVFSSFFKIPEIRSVFKFQFLIFSKLWKTLFLVFFSLYNLFKKYRKNAQQIFENSTNALGQKKSFSSVQKNLFEDDFFFSRKNCISEYKFKNSRLACSLGFARSLESEQKNSFAEKLVFEFFPRFSSEKNEKSKDVFKFGQKNAFFSSKNLSFLFFKNEKKFLKSFPLEFVSFVPLASLAALPSGREQSGPTLWDGRSVVAKQQRLKNFVLFCELRFGANRTFQKPFFKETFQISKNEKIFENLSGTEKNISLFTLSFLFFGRSVLLIPCRVLKIGSVFSAKIFEIVEAFFFAIYKFLEKPAEFMIEFIAFVFLLEWSSDIVSFLPDSVESSLWKSSQKMLRPVRIGTFGLNVGILPSMLGKPSKSEFLGSIQKLSFFGPLQFFSIVGIYTSANFSAFILQKRLFYVFENFPSVLFQPDIDILIRQKKGMIFWDIWAEILFKAAEKYNVNIPSFVTLKEEQEIFLEKLVRDSDFFQSFQSENFGLALDALPGATAAEQSHSSPFAEQAKRGTAPLVPHPPLPWRSQRRAGGERSRPTLRDRKSVGWEKRGTAFLDSSEAGKLRKTLKTNDSKNSFQSFSDFLQNFVLQYSPSKFFDPFFVSTQGSLKVRLSKNFQKKFQQAVISDLFIQTSRPNHLKMEPFQSLRLNRSFRGAQNLCFAQKDENFEIFSNTRNVNRWEANQYATFQSQETDFFFDIHVPKSLKHVHFLKYYEPAHFTLGSLICQIYSGIFPKQVSKNVLVIGEAGTAKTLFLQALAGETEMKIITENASRYAIVQRGVAVGMKFLRDVFDAIALQTPCFFVMEDLHIIGSKRPFLISENETGKANFSSFGLEQQEVHETNQMIYQSSRHSISDFRRPYKGDFSMGIPTNFFLQTFSSSFFSSHRSRSPNPFGEIEKNSFFYSLKKGHTFQNSQFFGGNFSSKIQSFLSSPLPFDSLEASARGLDPNQGMQDSENSNFSMFSGKTTRKNLQKIQSCLQFSKEQIFAPPATSPFTVLLMKEQKKLKPKKIVQETSWGGLSVDQILSYQKENSSVRAKISVFAEKTLNLSRGKFDMITDFLVLIDSVRSNRGFVVFGTTHKPSVLDPALRRPGRFDETLSLSVQPNFLNRFEIFQMNFENSASTFDFLDASLLAENFSETEIFQLILQTRLSLFHQYKYGIRKYNTSRSHPTLFPSRSVGRLCHGRGAVPSGEARDGFARSAKGAEQAERGTALAKKRLFSKISLVNAFHTSLKSFFFEDFYTQKQFSSMQNMNVQQFSIFRNSNLSRSSILPKGPSHLLSRAYSKIGVFLAESNFVQNPKSFVQLSLDLSKDSFQNSNFQQFFGNIFYDSRNVQNLQLGVFLSGKISEFLLEKNNILAQSFSVHSNQAKVSFGTSFAQTNENIFNRPSNLFLKKFVFFDFSFSSIDSGRSSSFSQEKNSKNQRSKSENDFQKFVWTKMNSRSTDGFEPNESEVFQKNVSWTAFGDDESWRVATPFLFSLVRKRFLFTKNLFLSKMLFFENSNQRKQPPSPPGSSIFMPAKKYENFKRTENDFFQKGRFSMNQKIQMHQKQRFLKQLYNVPIQQYFRSEIRKNQQTNFSTSFQELAYFDSFAQNVTSTGFFQRKYVQTRHRFSHINQWWNGMFPEHTRESTYLSDVDWRTMFVSAKSASRLTSQNKQIKENVSFLNFENEKNTLEFLMDFPDCEQYYNPRNRRWFFKVSSTKESLPSSTFWSLFEKDLQYEIFYHFLLESFQENFSYFDKQREMIDFFVYNLFQNGVLKEFHFLTTFSRF